MDKFLKYRPVYSTKQKKAIAEEFKRTKNTCYLDSTGSSLYSEKQIKMILADLIENIYGNPHSLHISSKRTEDQIDAIRLRLLEHFNTTSEEYEVIFTSGATASIKLIAETFNYGEKEEGTLVCLQNNHTSVFGMRNYSPHSKQLNTEDAFKMLSKKSNVSIDNGKYYNNLFAFPAQCNFSGTRFPLEWIENIRTGGLNSFVDTKSNSWFILLDAAAFLPSGILDLSVYKPDFVTMSFYKIFGYPTGLGALLVRRSCEDILQKTFYGGGTVDMVLSEHYFVAPKQDFNERFEDGTVPFLSILALKQGFDTIKRLNLNFELISKHTFSLAQYVYRNFITLHHYNGQPLATLYHDTTFEDLRHQGSTISFNLFRANGEYIGYTEVLQKANSYGIHLRTGCHCNPGGCPRSLNLQSHDIMKNFEDGHTCGDETDLIDGYPTGSVRISFGYMSTKKNADQFLKFVKDCFIEKPVVKKIPLNFEKLREHYVKLFYAKEFVKDEPEFLKKASPEHYYKKQISYETEYTEATLEEILIYPVKSCGAFVVSDSWIVTNRGFQFDREWMIVNAAGVCLSQKYNKKMCLIQPSVNLSKNTLRLSFKDKSSIVIQIDEAKNENKTYVCRSKVCGDRMVGWDCGGEVSNWLSEHLETPGLRLLRQYEPKNQESLNQFSFANQAHYLLTNSSSVDWVRNQVPDGELKEDLKTSLLRFRPNLVVKFSRPFEENEINRIEIDKITFKFAGKCGKYQMICVDQTTESISKEPLLTLSKIFRGRINFGVYLSQEGVDKEGVINVGSKVAVHKNVDKYPY